MYVWKTRAFEPTEADMTPTPLLSHLAGDFAPVIARLCPRPHEAFLTAPTARRHLLCLAVMLERAEPVLAEHVLFGTLRRAIREVIATPPPGLEGALGKLGEAAWSADDYRLLLARLADAGSGKLIHHGERIGADLIRGMSVLPQPFLERGRLVRECKPVTAEVLRDLVSALANRDGPEAAAEAAARWALAKTMDDALDLAWVDMHPEPAPPPFAGSERLRPLATKAALVDAGKRYRNCLRSYLPDAALGTSALYEWLDEPSVAVELMPDPLFGWRLEQARRRDNQGVPEAQRTAITAALGEMGVHVGLTAHDVGKALSRCQWSRYVRPTLEAEIRGLFGD